MSPCLTEHVWRDCDADTRVCMVCGVTLGPLVTAEQERARIAALLRHWATNMTAPWPRIDNTHKALLDHLAGIFGNPS